MPKDVLRSIFDRAIQRMAGRVEEVGRKPCKATFSKHALLLGVLCICLPACEKQEEEHHEAKHKVVVTTPISKDVVSTQEFVCQIHSSRHIEVRALESGYLEAIPVKEGQAVKQGETLFKIVPTLYQAKLDAELAEAQLAQIELNNTQRLYQQNVIAKPEVALAEAKLAKAQAKVALARAELNFTTVKAPFDGIVDHQHNQQGSLIAEGDILTTLSDNSVMWVYFNVPERDYLKYMTGENQSNLIIELELADGKKFAHAGKIGALEADFNNETGNIAFRADFPNPEGLLRHGQTGKILVSRVIKNAIVIPQRATFEILAKKYAFVVTQQEHPQDASEIGESHSGATPEPKADLDSLHRVADHPSANNHPRDDEGHRHETNELGMENGWVRQREIEILSEHDDIFLIKDGLGVDDKIILEGIRQVRDGEAVEYEFLNPARVLEQLKYHAE